MRPFALTLLALLLTSAASAPTPPYCQPVAFQDYVLPIGYQAVVITPAVCNRPALIRKENTITGSQEAPLLINVGQPRRIWLFTHRLSYSLDGKLWRRLQVKR
ncbi:hypothetical protein ACFFLM_04345 [Deinococcus oregonensis]|uniref:DUF2845 domain-containing protein n=1 Tax=Deinococcus oregonensis TaxID=1805970 RepID=A0ABV6AUN4_9DEIO